MNDTLGAALIVIGILFFISASVNARNAPDVSYLVGTFLPGFLCLILGLALHRRKKRRKPQLSGEEPERFVDHQMEARANQFKNRANFGVGGGIVLIPIGSAFGQLSQEWILPGGMITLVGWALFIWGCVNYVRWKGFSGWFGLLGYLLLLGVVILACYPNRRKKLLEQHSPEQLALAEALAVEDRKPGRRYLLALVPLLLPLIGLFWLVLRSHPHIDDAEWIQVARPELGFRAIMPGTPRLEEKTQETPTGKVELHKLMVEIKERNELYVIVALRFPDEVARKFGGTAKLLEVGRQDIVSASKGQITSERQITLSGYPGLELEVVPATGGIIKARICATKNHVYELWAGVPKIRSTSADVRRFLESFNPSN